MTKTRRRPGRTPGPVDNRERILAAARRLFAARGFRSTTTRAIAEEAGVDVALLAHYFGNKAQLFDAALELPPEVTETLSRAAAAPPESRPAELTRAYLGLWEDPATRSQLLGIVRSSMTGDAALDRLHQLLTGAVDTLQSDVDAGERAIDPGERQRLVMALSHLLGVAVGRHIGRVEPLASMSFEQLVEATMPGVTADLAVTG